MMNNKLTNEIRNELGLSLQKYLVIHNQFKKYVKYHD